jgi:hypothetical protein
LGAAGRRENGQDKQERCEKPGEEGWRERHFVGRTCAIRVAAIVTVRAGSRQASACSGRSSIPAKA